MATTQSYTVQISLQSQGARVIVRDLQQVSQQAKATQTSVLSLGNVLKGLGAYFSVRQFVEMADSITNLRNRMTLLTNSTSQVRLSTQALFQISKETRSDFDTTAQVYTRMALAARQLGESQSSLLAVTRSINEAVILSGTNAREARNGLIQLSQAIASNRLGGDELRSVLEQLPKVADILGDHLKKLGLAVNGSRGEVRQLGFEGKITSRIIIDAFKEAAQQLHEDFQKTVPTIGQSFEYLNTSVTEFIDKINTTGGITAGLARGIKLLADNLQTVAEALSAIAIAWTFTKIASWAKTFNVAAVAAKGLFAAIAAGEVTLQAAAGWIGLIVAGLVWIANKKFNLFGGEDVANKTAMAEAAAAIKNMSEYAPETRDQIKQLADQVNFAGGKVKELSESWTRNDEEMNRWTQVRDQELQKLLDLTSKSQKGMQELTLEARKLADAWDKIKRGLDAEYASLQLNTHERKVSVELAQIEEKLRAKGASGAQLQAMLAEADVMVRRNLAQKDYTAILDKMQQPYIDLLYQGKAWRDLMEKEPQFTEQAKRALIELRVAALEPLTDAHHGIQKAILEQQLEYTKLGDAAGKAYREITDPALQYKQQVAALNAVLAENADLQDEVNQKLIQARISYLETKRDALSGAERGFLKIRDMASDVASSIETTLTNAFNNAEDAMVDFFDTGEFKYEEFLKTLKRDLIRSSLRQLESGLFKLLPIPGKESTPGGDLAKSASDTASMATAGASLNTAGSTLLTAGQALLVAAQGLGASTTAGAAGGAGGGFGSWLGGLFGGAGAAAGSTPAPTNGAGVDVSGGTGNFPGFSPTLDTPAGMQFTAPQNTTNFYITTPNADDFKRSQGQLLARSQAAQYRAGMRNR